MADWQKDAREQHDEDGKVIVDTMTCGTCGRSWNDALVTSRTPVPSGRCPFEDEHEEPFDPTLPIGMTQKDREQRPLLCAAIDALIDRNHFNRLVPEEKLVGYCLNNDEAETTLFRALDNIEGLIQDAIDNDEENKG